MSPQVSGVADGVACRQFPAMPPTPRRRRWLIAIASFFVLFTVTGFFILPPIVKSQAEKRLSAALGRKVTIGNVRLNPYALSMTIENFDIQEQDGRSSFLGWSRLYVNVDLLSSLVGDWVISDVELEGYHIAVVIHPDNTFNFSDLLAKATALTAPTPGAAPSKPMHPVRVGLMAVSQARLEFTDLTRKHPFNTVMGPLTFVLSNFRTVGSSGAPYHFEAVTESGEKLSWTGTLAATPLSSKGEFAVENLLLKKYAPYYEDTLRADLTDGLLTIRGGYEARLDGKTRVLKLSKGEVHLQNLQVVENPGGLTALELPNLDVTGIEADAIALKATVERVALAGGHVAVRREKDGALNLLAMLAPEPTPGVAKVSAPAMPLPEFKIGEVTLKDFKITATDNAAPRPAQLELSNLQFSLKNATLADGAVMPLTASFSWAPQGTVQTTGTVSLKPQISADLKTDVTAFAILPLSPYLEQFVNARITQGTVTTSNALHASLPADGGLPAIRFAGDVTVEKFGLVDGLLNEDLAGFGTLALKGLRAGTSPQIAVALDEIAVTAPYARIIVNGDPAKPYLDQLKEADQHINLLAVLKPLKAASAEKKSDAAPATAATVTATPASAPAPTPAASLPKVEVGRVVITDGDFSFTDRAIEPNVHLVINSFGGTIAGLSSENMAKADVDLKGMVDGSGPIAITGKLDPLGAVRSVDLKIDFKNIDLLPTSPYAGKFAGYELARGQLVVDTRVTIADRKLDSATVVTLNQFTFGSATHSPDATGLPVRLGVALLKDGDGRIVIDMPVQGNLDDPDFRYGKVVIRVLVNLLTKAATSPFSLLGSMFGGGGDELAFQEFTPGESQLLPAELPKLDTLVKALTNRPALSLGIEGSYDASADAYALKRAKLADLVRRKIWEEQHTANPNIAPPDQLVITPEQNAAMVKKLFNEKFPPGTKFGAPLAAAPAVAALPPPPPPGFFKRILNFITFADQREKRAAKKAEEKRAADREQALRVAEATGLPLEDMNGRLAEAMTVDDNDLRALATARAQRVRDRLINEGHIATDRLFLSQGTDATKQNKGPRVFLSLQ
jgi:hypothetical protein